MAVLAAVVTPNCQAHRSNVSCEATAGLESEVELEGTTTSRILKGSRIARFQAPEVAMVDRGRVVT